jgi:hypothetical protein
MLYVFDPIYKQGQTRWNGFFRRPGLATKILELWVSRENSETAREEVDVWASDYIAEQARMEAKEITAAKALQTGGNVDADYVDGFSMRTMYDFLQLHAKTAMKVFEAFATSARNARSNLPARVAKRASVNQSPVQPSSTLLMSLKDFNIQCARSPWGIQSQKHFFTADNGHLSVCEWCTASNHIGSGSPRNLRELPESDPETSLPRKSPRTRDKTWRTIAGNTTLDSYNL